MLVVQHLPLALAALQLRFLSDIQTQTCVRARARTRTHTHARTNSVGLLRTIDQPVVRDATYTKHKKRKRLTSTTSAELEPAITAIERAYTYALSPTATGIGHIRT